MPQTVEIWEKPSAEEFNLLLGWRQWADAGEVSSGLPAYLVQKMGARPIGRIRPDGFYLFQLPGTHDLIRPVIRFHEGFPESIETPRTDIYYAGNEQRGLLILLGDEPHQDVDRYINAVLDLARQFNTRRILSFGGVYGELPYDLERAVSGTYSLRELKNEVNRLAVTLSDYQGGASIDSFLCRRAGEQGLAMISLYAFVPSYDLTEAGQPGGVIRLEEDYTAWLGVARRAKYLLKLDLDLSDLESKSQALIEAVRSRLADLESLNPEIDIHGYIQRLSENFTEVTFNPLDEVWEDELRRLVDKFDLDED